MKKIFAILLILCAAPAFATIMCAEDDTINIVLDPAVNGTGNAYNAGISEWSATFQYGMLFGISACIDVKGTVNGAVEELRSEDGELVVGGEFKGQHCWCKMTHPATSRWVFRASNASVGACRSNCAGYCGDYVRSAGAFRAGVFGSLGD